MTRLAGWILLGLTLAGCATQEVTQVATPPPPPPPPPVSAPPLPELPVTQIEEEPARVVPRKLFSLSVRNVSIREVLLAFGKRSDLNIVFGPEVEGQVTIDLKRVTLDEALDALLTPIGFVYRREGNFVRVAKPAPETRVFTVNYIPTLRTGSGSLSATAGGATGAVGAVGGGGATVGATSSVTSTDNADLWIDLQNTLKGLLTKDGTVVLSKAAGLIAVTDLPQNVMRVAQYLELVEGTAHRQVVIEAQIIEVDLTRDFSTGIDWNLVAKNLTVGGQLIQGTLTGGGLTAGTLVAQTLAPASSIFQLGLATRLGSQTLNVLLKALSQQGQVAVLSKPKLSALNNQKAVMKIATDDVFFTVTRTREPTTGIVTETETTQTVTEGIVLDVTPQIGVDDTIMMSIRPSVSERVGQATSPQGSVVPIIAVRAADTVVRVKDGDTVLIGGLMQSRSTRNRSGVPVLQDIPVAGGLFKKREDQDRKTELVILLTPTVVIGRRQSQLTPQELQLLREASRVPPLR